MHGPRHGQQKWPGPGCKVCSQVAAQASQIGVGLAAVWSLYSNMVLGGNKESGAVVQSLMATEMTDLNTNSGSSKAMNTDMALCGSISLTSQHGHRRQPSIRVAFGGNTDHDINEDPGYSRITDPDIVLRILLRLDIIVTQVFQIGITLATRRSLDNNMAPGDGPDLMHSHSHQWYQEHGY